MPDVTTGTWYSLSLQVAGGQVTASINGTQVAQVTNSAYGQGLAGIESSWSDVQYNDFSVAAS